MVIDWGTSMRGPEYEVDRQYTLGLRVCPEYSCPLRPTWTVEDSTIVGLEQSSDSTALLTAKRSGTTQLRVELRGTYLQWTADVVVRDRMR
jgi:hypothetical protein